MPRARHATYRVQLTPAKGFVDVVDDLPRLAQLGISHLYLSPISEAIPGSAHGYDVVDHTAVRAELGGLDGLTALLDAAGRNGLGVIVDHVPNHASIARPELNTPWWTMLRDGPESPAARWFDVDWATTAGQVILPVLADPLDEAVERGRLHVDLDRDE
nr:alpha-amylase family glycosyl hydrolase [Actinomycetota bacterium]